MTLTMGGMQARKSSALKREVPNLQVVADSSWETCKQFSTLNRLGSFWDAVVTLSGVLNRTVLAKISF